jgi:hypothetical protein
MKLTNPPQPNAISHMKSSQSIGVYLLSICAVLLVWSIWQLERGSGHADFSFVIFAPFAIGLLRNQRWAILGAGILGIISSSLIVGMAVIHSISGLADLEVALGPLQLSNPSAVAIWILALAFVFAIGVPMASVLMAGKIARHTR